MFFILKLFPSQNCIVRVLCPLYPLELIAMNCSLCKTSEKQTLDLATWSRFCLSTVIISYTRLFPCHPTRNLSVLAIMNLLIAILMTLLGSYWKNWRKIGVQMQIDRQTVKWNFQTLKCIWHKNFFLLIWKAFQNTEEWRFSFWNIFFLFRDIDVFLLCKLDQWWCHTTCKVEKVVKTE